VTSPASNVLPHLEKVRRTGPASWSARCPSHEDRGPSLSIREADDGRLLMHCFAGCGIDEIVGSLGLDLSDLFPPRPQEHGGGNRKERKPFRPSDLILLAAHEASIVAIAAADMAQQRDLSDPDRARLVESAARLCDLATFCRDGV